MMAAVALMAATGALAQRIQVVDSEGNPVSYASVLNPKAEYIGITDLEGVVPDLKGAKDITVTHVAFKTKMNYANVRQFERDHSIPALVPAVQAKLNELWKSE